MNNSAHIPVLMEEVVEALNLPQGKIIVDATYGRGGHSSEILKCLDSDGRLIAIDRDNEAVELGKLQLQGENRVEIVHAKFSELTEILEQRDLSGKIDAILFDFGVSSPQLDNAHRGFSFSKDGPLDMRMDQSSGITAAAWIQQADEKELVRVLKSYGEERFARKVAKKIKQHLVENEIDRTAILTKLVSEAVPIKEKGKHPATRTFQAIRIAVNTELVEIESVLPQALEALAPGGRMVVISFHSLEDRLVKRFFRKESKGDPFPHDLPVTSDMLKPKLRLVGKPEKPGQSEIKTNPRSRSAVLRVAEKVTCNA